jgi:hypothetical protein
MTVAEVYAPASAFRYRCTWEEGGKPRSRDFRPEELLPADERRA